MQPLSLVPFCPTLFCVFPLYQLLQQSLSLRTTRMDVHYAVIVILLLIIIVLLISFVAAFCVFYVCRLRNNNNTNSKQSAVPTISEPQLPIQDIENQYSSIADLDIDKSEEYIDDNYSSQGEFLSTIKQEDTDIDDTLSMQADFFVYSDNENSDTEISSNDIQADVHHFYIQ